MKIYDCKHKNKNIKKLSDKIAEWELIIPKRLTEETEEKEERSNNYEEMKKIYESIRDAFDKEINNKGVR